MVRKLFSSPDHLLTKVPYRRFYTRTIRNISRTKRFRSPRRRFRSPNKRFKTQTKRFQIRRNPPQTLHYLIFRSIGWSKQTLHRPADGGGSRGFFIIDDLEFDKGQRRRFERRLRRRCAPATIAGAAMKDGWEAKGI